MGILGLFHVLKARNANESGEAMTPRKVSVDHHLYPCLQKLSLCNRDSKSASSIVINSILIIAHRTCYDIKTGGRASGNRRYNGCGGHFLTKPCLIILSPMLATSIASGVLKFLLINASGY